MRYGGGRHWYSLHGAEGRGRAPEVIFLGTSRVAGAVDPQAFRDRIREVRGEEIIAFNLARPGSTLEEHRLGLRALCREHPGILRGTDVLLEAPGGLPDRSTPRDLWFVPQASGHLAPLLRFADLGDLWMVGADLETFARTALLWLSRRSALLENRRRIRARFLCGGGRATATILEALLPVRPEAPLHPDESLDPGARVRARRSAYAFARRKLREVVGARIARPAPPVDWKETSLARLAGFLASVGARLVLFPMPVSSVQARELEVPARRTELASLRSALKRWKVPMLACRFEVNDEDFPDLWHLRLQRRTEFSRNLAEAWMKIARRKRAATRPPR